MNVVVINNFRRPSPENFGIKQLLIVLFIGSVFAGIGYFATQSTKIEPGWKKIDGTIVDVAVINNSNYNEDTNTTDNETTYAPVVNYTVDGQTYRTTSNWSSSFKPTIGHSHKVAYNPKNPSEAKVLESTTVKIAFYFFYLIGLLTIVYGCVMFALGLRRKNMI